MNLLAWNVRGLGSLTKLPTISNLIPKYNLDMVGLTEINVRRVDIHLVNRIWDSNNISYDYCEALSSHSGGLMILWDTEAFRVSNSFKGARWIIFQGEIIGEKLEMLHWVSIW